MSGYLTQMRMRSWRVVSWVVAGICRESTICLAACSVIRVETMQVTRIMRMTPLSMSSVMRYWPAPTSSFMPTMTMAMAPAAWADVSPNIMLPSALGMRKSRLDR